MDEEKARMKEDLISIGAELFRFRDVYMRLVAGLEIGAQNRFLSRFSWFTKKVDAALEHAGIRIIDLKGQLYDPGMAVTPLNIDEFRRKDKLYIAQTIEPIIMDGENIYKIGTVVLGRIEK